MRTVTDGGPRLTVVRTATLTAARTVTDGGPRPLMAARILQ
jgi:hypothetical protein